MARSFDLSVQALAPVEPSVPPNGAAAITRGAGTSVSDSNTAATIGAVVTGGAQDGVTATYNSSTRDVALTNTDKGSVAVVAHEALLDPHPQYTTDAEATTIADAHIAVHAAATDPHGDRAYADGLLTAHGAAVDPHPQYVRTVNLSELVDDRVGSLLLPGSGVTLTYNDALNTLTIGLSASASFTHTQNSGNVATISPTVTYSRLDGQHLAWVDSTRATNARQHELRWGGGAFQGRFVSDGYSAAATWLNVEGTSASVSAVDIYAGANSHRIRVTGGVVTLGSRTVISNAVGTVSGVGDPGDLVIGRSPTTGVIYFGTDSSGTRFLNAAGSVLEIGSAFTALRPAANNGIELGAPTRRLNAVHTSNLVVGDSGAVGALDSGSYTPTWTPGTGATVTSTRTLSWMRVGNVVTVAGSLGVIRTSGAEIAVECTLPVAATITDAYQVGGAGHIQGGTPLWIQTGTSNRIRLSAAPIDNLAREWTFTFTYRTVN